ncbi:MAG: glycosyltransferase [Lachnospiraceae bacterium]|nr:glycosyltransferase [Lachnospiraceae bacterium]
MNRKIKICLFIKGFHNGGVEKVFENYFSNMDRNKFELHIVTHMDPYIPRQKYFESMGFIVHQLSPVHVIRINKQNIKEYENLFKTYKFDIVHNNFPEKILPLYMAKKHGVPIRILHSHCDYNIMADKCNPIIRPIYRKILRYNAQKLATHCIGCGKQAGESAFGKKIMDNPKNFVLHNAINTDSFHYDMGIRTTVRKQLGISDEYLVGHVGRYEGNQKNQSFVIDIFSKLLEKEPKSRLLMIGEGPLKEKIIEKANRLCILDKIIFTGSVSNVADYLQAMDCFVFPSLYEGFSVVTVEVQCTGLKGAISDSLDPEMNTFNQFGVFSLNQEPEIWADYLLGIKNYERSDKAEELIEAGYDIRYESKKLKNFYVEAYENTLRY